MFRPAGFLCKRSATTWEEDVGSGELYLMQVRGEALLGCAAVLSDLAARRRALRWASWLSNFRCLGRLVLLFREGQRDVCGKVPKYIVWGCDLASDKCIKITL